MDRPVVIIWTCKDREEAKQIVTLLLEKHLIACASIIPKVDSFFRWEGKIDHAEESKVFLKTLQRHFTAVRDLILANCSYQVPEILQIDVSAGCTSYLDWIEKTVS